MSTNGNDQDLEEDLRLIVSTIKSTLIKRNSEKSLVLLNKLEKIITALKSKYFIANGAINVSKSDISDLTDSINLEA